jgi:hypothetical protein
MIAFFAQERALWRGFEIVEYAPQQDASDWFGWMGGDALIVYSNGMALTRFSAPFTWRLEDFTGDGMLDLIVEQPPTGFSGCCDSFAVFVDRGGTLTHAVHVQVFGSVQSTDGRGVLVGYEMLRSHVLPNVDRVAVPFVCAWSGNALEDVTMTSGIAYVETWLSERRAELEQSLEEATWLQEQRAKALVAGSLLFGADAASEALAVVNEVAGPDVAAAVRALIPDFASNLNSRYRCDQ